MKQEAKTYAAVLKSYARQAPYYDGIWRHYNNATLRATMETVPWGDVQWVLDVGCGTGLLEQETQSFPLPLRMVGVDICADMLRQGRQKSLPRDRFSWVVAAAEEMPFRSAAFDAVLCANSFHYFRRPLAAAREFQRVVRPGGRLVVTDWCDDYLACRICDWVLRLIDPAHFRMYSMKECDRLLRSAGFQIEIARKFKIDWLWGLMTFRGRAA